MKKILQNTYKGKVTSIAGIAIYIMVTHLIFKGTIPLWVDGFVGYSVATVLLLAPDTIISMLKKFIGGNTTH